MSVVRRVLFKAKYIVALYEPTKQPLQMKYGLRENRVLRNGSIETLNFRGLYSQFLAKISRMVAKGLLLTEHVNILSVL